MSWKHKAVNMNNSVRLLSAAVSMAEYIPVIVTILGATLPYIINTTRWETRVQAIKLTQRPAEFR